MRTKWMLTIAALSLSTGTVLLAAEDHSAHGAGAAPAASSAGMGGMPGMPGMQAMQGMQGMQGMQEGHMLQMQQTHDRVEIEDLMWRYARALDSLDADGYAAVYTEDGQFGTGANATKGRAALKKMVLDLKKSRDDRAAKGEKSPGTLHMTANHVIEFLDKDRAVYHAYWMTMFPAMGAESPARVGAVGRGADELVRVNGRWLIKVRNTAPQN